MFNAETRITGNILTIKVDLSRESGPSNSGKTIIIASAQDKLEGTEIRVGLNVYKPIRSR